MEAGRRASRIRAVVALAAAASSAVSPISLLAARLSRTQSVQAGLLTTLEPIPPSTPHRLLPSTVLGRRTQQAALAAAVVQAQVTTTVGTVGMVCQAAGISVVAAVVALAVQPQWAPLAAMRLVQRSAPEGLAAQLVVALVEHRPARQAAQALCGHPILEAPALVQAAAAQGAQAHHRPPVGKADFMEVEAAARPALLRTQAQAAQADRVSSLSRIRLLFSPHGSMMLEALHSAKPSARGSTTQVLLHGAKVPLAGSTTLVQGSSESSYESMNVITDAFLDTGPGPKKPNPRGWTTANKALAGTAAAGLIGDWLTTIDIARRPNEFGEMNPALGRHPSVGRVNTFFGLSALGSGLLASKLPPKWRNVFLAGLSGLEAAMVLRNATGQARVGFNFRI